MGLKIVVPGVDFSSVAIDRSNELTTNRTDLVGEYQFGASNSKSIFNSANSKPLLTVVGSPIYADNYVTLSQDNWFDTNLLDSQELTFMIVCSGSTSQFNAFGNFNGSNTTDHVVLFSNVSGKAKVQATSNDASVPYVELTAVDTTSAFKALCGRTTGSSNYTIKADQFKDGALLSTITTKTTKTRKVQTTPTFAIGSSRGSATLSGTLNYAAVLVWNRCLSDAELLAAYKEVYANLAKVGISC